MEGIVCIASKNLFDMGNAEERDKFSPVGFGAVDFEVWGGGVTIIKVDGHVVGNLDGILDCKEPEFHGKVMFCEVVAGNCANVFPVCFCEAVLVLAFPRCTGGDGIVFVEEFFNNASDEFEVSVGKHFFGEFSNAANELLE